MFRSSTSSYLLAKKKWVFTLLLEGITVLCILGYGVVHWYVSRAGVNKMRTLVYGRDQLIKHVGKQGSGGGVETSVMRLHAVD